MGLIAEQSHLTVLDPDFEAKRNRTYPGMAHFAGTGPSGQVCRSCLFWTGCGVDSGYYAKNGKHGGQLKPRACARHRALMGGEIGPAIPHGASACKYFDESKTPPAITERS
jgi:hypothetical protein